MAHVGYTVLATRDVPAGHRIPYEGEPLTPDEANRREKLYSRMGEICYFLEVRDIELYVHMLNGNCEFCCVAWHVL